MTLDADRPRFRNERYDLSALDDGTSLALVPLCATRADALARELVTFGPWRPEHYAVDPERFARGLIVSGDGAVRYAILRGDATAGVIVIRSPWLAGPYLQLLAVLPEHQGQGIGHRVLAWMEAEARGPFGNLWLCVSAFNVRAAAFYRCHGFASVATLDALIKPEIDEILMRKRLV